MLCLIYFHYTNVWLFFLSAPSHFLSFLGQFISLRDPNNSIDSMIFGNGKFSPDNSSRIEWLST